MPRTAVRSLALEGARRILTDCLGMQPGDRLGLFWDETTTAPADIIQTAAIDEGVDVRSRHVPIRTQQAFTADADLAWDDQDVLSESRAVITCISADGASTAYRTALIRFGTTDGKRIGHMPGADMRLLAYAANIDYAKAEQRCDDLSLALTLARRIRLRSFLCDHRNVQHSEHDLECELGGIARPPISSTGIIALGTWGNIPGGETFVAPLENSGRGEYVLNGAFRECVVRRGEHLVLSFDGGHLTHVNGAEDLRRRFNELFDLAKSRNDHNWSILAEVGIGVNPGVRRLTGNSLFDEKCAGTAHIALGDNERYGGHTASVIHEDLVTKRPSLWLDEKPILDHGTDAFVPSQWYDTLEATQPVQAFSALDTEVRRTPVKAWVTASRTLRVRRRVAAGRQSEYQIGTPVTSVILGLVYQLVPSFPYAIRLRDLQAAATSRSIQGPVVTGALSILLRHGVIEPLCQ